MGGVRFSAIVTDADKLFGYSRRALSQNCRDVRQRDIAATDFDWSNGGRRERTREDRNLLGRRPGCLCRRDHYAKRALVALGGPRWVGRILVGGLRVLCMCEAGFTSAQFLRAASHREYIEAAIRARKVSDCDCADSNCAECRRAERDRQQPRDGK